jgi:hypothetical protein
MVKLTSMRYTGFMSMTMIALSPRQQLEQMSLILGSKAAVGRVLGGKYPSEVSRLISTARKPNRATRDRITGTFTVVEELVERGYEGRDVEPILTEPWPALQGKSPVDLIAVGEIAAVIDALDRQVDPAKEMVEMGTRHETDSSSWVAERRNQINRNIAARLEHSTPLDEDFAFLVSMPDDQVLSFAGQARRALVALESDQEFEAFLDSHWETFTPLEMPAPAIAEREAKLPQESVISLEELLMPGGAMASRRFSVEA